MWNWSSGRFQRVSKLHPVQLLCGSPFSETPDIFQMNGLNSSRVKFATTMLVMKLTVPTSWVNHRWHCQMFCYIVLSFINEWHVSYLRLLIDSFAHDFNYLYHTIFPQHILAEININNIKHTIHITVTSLNDDLNKTYNHLLSEKNEEVLRIKNTLK